VYHISHFIMQNPTDQAEASIPVATTVTNNGTDWKRTVNVCRKAAKRTHPFDLAVDELDLVSRPQAEDIPARKKPRLEEPLPTTTTDAAARKNVSPDVLVGLSPPAADNDDTNADPETDTQPNAAATGSWTLQEDAKLTRAVANTSKKKRGKEYKINWPAVAALVPGRTRNQCNQRWHDVLDPSIGRASGRKGKWTEVEDSKLKSAVQTHADMNWVAISLLVPGRKKKQCLRRWHDVLDPNNGRASGRKGKWTEDEDSKLKDAVHAHGDEEWSVISALVPRRTKKQCWTRWHDVLDPSIGTTSGRKGNWSAVEDSQLKHAVQTRGDKEWVAISLLVPGRTKKQCWNKWKHMKLYHSTVGGPEHRNLKKAPAVGQDPHSL
jgi:hypothetical protein